MRAKKINEDVNSVLVGKSADDITMGIIKRLNNFDVVHDLAERFSEEHLFHIKPELVNEENYDEIAESIKMVFVEAAQYVNDVILSERLEFNDES